MVPDRDYNVDKRKAAEQNWVIVEAGEDPDGTTYHVPVGSTFNDRFTDHVDPVDHENN